MLSRAKLYTWRKMPKTLYIVFLFALLVGCKEERPVHYGSNSKSIFDRQGRYTEVAFWNSLQGVVAGEKGGYYTLNGGAKWQRSIYAFPNDTIQDLVYLNDSVVLAVGKNFTYRSGDKGFRFLKTDSVGGYQMAAIDSNRVITMKSDSLLYLSLDGGQNNTQIPTNDTTVSKFNQFGDTVIYFQDNKTYISYFGGIGFEEFIGLLPNENYHGTPTGGFTSLLRYRDSATFNQGALVNSDLQEVLFFGENIKAISEREAYASGPNGITFTYDEGRTWNFLFKKKGASFLVDDWSFVGDTLFVIESPAYQSSSNVEKVILR